MQTQIQLNWKHFVHFLQLLLLLLLCDNFEANSYVSIFVFIFFVFLLTSVCVILAHSKKYLNSLFQKRSIHNKERMLGAQFIPWILHKTEKKMLRKISNISNSAIRNARTHTHTLPSKPTLSNQYCVKIWEKVTWEANSMMDCT